LEKNNIGHNSQIGKVSTKLEINKLMIKFILPSFGYRVKP